MTETQGRAQKIFVTFLLLGTLGLAGCASAVLGAAAGGATVVAQDRTAGNALDDFGIQAQINEKLFAENAALHSRVNLTVTEGNVVMTGNVPNPQDRVTASRLAWQVNGVRSVSNELQVNNTSTIADAARDTWITTQLRAEILTDLSIRDINYTLDTVNGVVYIMGIARSQEELNEVLAYARAIKHVKRVVSFARVARVVR